MCNQSTWSNLWNCIRRTYLTIKNHQRKFYKILTSWRIQDTKTKLDDKKQCFYIPVKFLVTHEYKKPKRWHANMYMISQKNYNHLFATKHMWKAEKIKKITYPRKGTCVYKHLFFMYPAVFSKSEYTLWSMACSLMGHHAEVQYQCKSSSHHWAALWQGYKCSPDEWQHRRMVQNNSRSKARMSSVTHPFQHFSRTDHVWCPGRTWWEG